MTVIKQYLTTTEVAKMLGISRVTVFRKIKSGEIKAEKIGRNFAVLAGQFLNQEELTQDKKEEIRKIVKKAVKEYGQTFKLLGAE